MATTFWSVPALMVRSLTGVRQRVILVILAAALALPMHGGLPGLSPIERDGSVQTTVQIAGELLPLACHGTGSVTILFLERDGMGSLGMRGDLQNRATAFARVCTLSMSSLRDGSPGTGASAGVTALDRANRIALDIARMLADRRASAPYVLVATVDDEPIATPFLENAGDLANGALLIDPASGSARGWVIDSAGARREITLKTIDQALLALRSLVWPPVV